ncbi:MAG: metallophosphoesterase family protein, partial [Candidatus Pacebacteria bacterium]|nr:metallophosphoesterase family protein [Candidatus Paceibacterota bacterium]
LIVSDIHLGSKVCRTGKILSLLNESTFKTLIVNGDLFDSNDIGRLNVEHWKVLDLISSLTKEHKVYLIGGNHGRKLDKMAKKLGIALEEELLFSVGDRQFLCFHGDEFDAFIKHLPLTTSVFTKLYYAIQQFDGNEQRVSMILKKLSKKILGISKRQQKKAIKVGHDRHATVVICSHTHLPHVATEDAVLFLNSGSFCSNPCTYITIDRTGKVELTEI